MKVTVNDETRELPDGFTVAQLIEHLGLSHAICAAEVNQAIVPRGERERRELHEGDRVEVVTLVGGG
jgi:sulfur carrier protein